MPDAEVIADGENLSYLLVERGLARRYDGEGTQLLFGHGI